MTTSARRIAIAIVASLPLVLGIDVSAGADVSAISFRRSSVASTAQASGLTVPKPTGLTAGEVMVAAIAVKRSGSAPTPPPGWSTVRSDTGGAGADPLTQAL